MARATWSFYLTATVALFVFVYLVSVVAEEYQLKCIESELNGQTYCVRERPKMELAANLLADVSERLQKLVHHVGNKYKDRADVQRLVQNFNPKRISETLPTETNSAFTENKGEKMSFCLDKDKTGRRLIDTNTLCYVGIHELAHVMTKSVGHHLVFWENFKFLLIEASKIGIYSPVDYKHNPTSFCKMTITDNPMYDLH